MKYGTNFDLETLGHSSIYTNCLMICLSPDVCWIQISSSSAAMDYG